jgi:hypothetical protein
MDELDSCGGRHVREERNSQRRSAIVERRDPRQGAAVLLRAPGTGEAATDSDREEGGSQTRPRVTLGRVERRGSEPLQHPPDRFVAHSSAPGRRR